MPADYPNFGSYLPPEYGAEMMASGEAARQRSEEEQLRAFIENMNSLGRTYSGSTLRTAVNTLLGPAMERRQENLRQIALQGAQAGREERMIRSRQQYDDRVRAQQNAWDIQKMREQESIDARLMALRAKYAEEAQPGFWDQVGSGFAQGLGNIGTGFVRGGVGQLGGWIDPYMKSNK